MTHVELDFEVHGPSDGPVLVLLAGLGTQRHWWPPGLVTLLAADHRLVLPDNRDVGGSPRLDHLGPAAPRIEALQRGEEVDPPYTLRDMAGDVVALLDRLEVDRAHVVGASMGAMIAQHVAIGWPERTASLTSIMSTTGGPDIPAGDPEVLAMLLESPPTHSEQAYVEASVAASRMSANSPLFDEEDARRRHRLSYRDGLNQEASGRHLLAALLDGDRTQRLTRVEVPTLVIHGEVDPMLRIEGGRATAAAIPGAKMLELADVGHELPRAVHGEVADAIADHVAAAQAEPRTA
ncbi:MAG: alpha/beta fold hydrolase [Trueperaceae bacterium]|nr:alpha/beta fold hydrolase [Trueperaceae bacterium]